MPITALDPTTALIVIDLQKGITGHPAAHPVEGIVAHSRALLDAFRAQELPVVLVNVTGAPSGRTDEGTRLPAQLPDDWADLIDELGRQSGDHLVSKNSRGAFTNTGLHEKLTGLGVTQVVITGIATASGVESTARQAHEYGYNVTVVTDAVTDRSLEAHEHSISTIFPRIAETGTTAEILALVATRR
jgi:nicotinamidase-related amidase